MRNGYCVAGWGKCDIACMGREGKGGERKGREKVRRKEEGKGEGERCSDGDNVIV